MEFGRSQIPVNKIDHKLPSDGRWTTKTLNETERKCDFYVGLSRWGQKEWCGTIYPEKTREKDFLSHYARHFNSIELNATFFSIPTKESIIRWKDQVAQSGNTDFIFIPKVPKSITHTRKLKDSLVQMDEFIGAVSELGEQLGPIFFQMGEHFGPSNFDGLKSFVSDLPTDQKFFFEVRNENWFNNDIDKDKYFELLARHNIGSIISDTSGRRDTVHMELTTGELFLRFVGNGGDYWDSDYSRIDEWVERIGQWKQKGLKAVYFNVHQYDETYSPQLASYVIDKLNTDIGAELTPLKL